MSFASEDMASRVQRAWGSGPGRAGRSIEARRENNNTRWARREIPGRIRRRDGAREA